MLSPEIWNFQEPKSYFRVDKQEVKKPHFLKKIDNFYFNHFVTVFLPDTFKVPENLTEVLNTDCEYYKVEKLNLSDLIDASFIASFIKSGKLSLLNLNSRIDCDACSFGITPVGELILNLDKVTYQSFGIEGKVSHFHPKTKEKYIVRIDLKADDLQRHDSARFIRLKSCLAKLGCFDVIASWDAPSDTICPSSLAKYFADLQYNVALCRSHFESETFYSVNVPELSDECDISEFAEWLGMLSIGGNLTDGSFDSYTNTYETPEPHRTVGQVKQLRWRGFFSADKIAKFMREIMKFKSDLWSAVYVQGFSDSPVGWKNEEHHYYTNGDNGYLVLLNGEKCWFCMQECSRKQYK